MRKAGSNRGAVSAYPRQLEALIRLAEAHAKMRYCFVVFVIFFLFCLFSALIPLSCFCQVFAGKVGVLTGKWQTWTSDTKAVSEIFLFRYLGVELVVIAFFESSWICLKENFMQSISIPSFSCFLLFAMIRTFAAVGNMWARVEFSFPSKACSVLPFRNQNLLWSWAFVYCT